MLEELLKQLKSELDDDLSYKPVYKILRKGNSYSDDRSRFQNLKTTFDQRGQQFVIYEDTFKWSPYMTYNFELSPEVSSATLKLNDNLAHT